MCGQIFLHRFNKNLVANNKKIYSACLIMSYPNGKKFWQFCWSITTDEVIRPLLVEFPIEQNKIFTD